MKRKKKLTSDDIVRTRGLFDHIKHIRQIQSKDYYDMLTESERKTFNKFMILRVLSMDHKILNKISKISKYVEIIPEKQLYNLLIACIPKDYKFYPYIKKSTKDINLTIIDCICKMYRVGIRDAMDYYKLLIQTESGISHLIEVIESFGHSQSEIEKLFETSN
jgi:hypothetical protein